MKVFVWHNGGVPDSLEVKQVYGVAFSRDGRVYLREEEFLGKKVFSLAGGKPEPCDADHEATLRREFIEEVNTQLEEETYVIGYQEVHEPSGIPVYAQLRMVAVIKSIGKKQPDPDGGRIYDRLLTTPKKAIKLLSWGKPGRKMIKQAVKIAKRKLGIKTFAKKDEYV